MLSKPLLTSEDKDQPMRLHSCYQFMQSIRGRQRFIACLAFAFVFSIAGTANGLEILYSDNFNGSSSSDLAGTTPDTTIGSNTWQGDTGFKADGSATGVVGGIYLPFTPSAGAIYTITASFTTASSSTGWMGVGFSESSPTSTNPFIPHAA